MFSIIAPLIASFAPTIASVFKDKDSSPSVLKAATNALSSAIGLENATPEVLYQYLLKISHAKEQDIRAADQSFILTKIRLENEASALEYADRKGARNHNEKISEDGKEDKNFDRANIITPIVGLICLGLGLAGKVLKLQPETIGFLLVGGIGIIQAYVYYHFVSSRGSKTKENYLMRK
jgi:hypothetical protein